MRAAQTDGVEFFESVGLANERIVVGNVVIGGRAIGWLADDRMADGATTAIYVETPDAGEEIVGDDLGVAAVFVIAISNIEKAV